MNLKEKAENVAENAKYGSIYLFCLIISGQNREIKRCVNDS